MKNQSKGFRYCVLYTHALQQWNAAEVIRRALPEGRGEVFYPCAELWMKSLEQKVVVPLFPGYVFVRSDLGRGELHDFIRSHRREILSFVKEVRVSEKRIAGEDPFSRETDTVTDLTDGEAEFLDFMLGFRYEGERESQDGSESAGFSEIKKAPEAPDISEIKKAPEAPDVSESRVISKKDKNSIKNGKRLRKRKIPKIGVLMMSYGYRDEGKKVVVMEGPLRGFEDYIKQVRPKERRAYLKLEIGGKAACVGLTLFGKKYWFPDDKNAPDILSDGTEVFCDSIAESLMRHKKGDAGKENPVGMDIADTLMRQTVKGKKVRDLMDHR